MDFFLPNLNTAIAGTFTLVLVVYYLVWKSKTKTGKNKPAPEAGGSWPIIGHLHLLAGAQLPHIILGDMADKYGPVFTIRLGVHQALVVSSWETAKELFTTYDVAVTSRPKFAAAKHLGYNFAMFGFSPHGSYWREMRKITSLELLSNRRLELLKHIRVSETESSMKELYKLWKEKKDSSGRVLVDMKQWFGDLNLNVILRMVAGKRYYGAMASDEKEVRRCQKVMRDFFYYLGLFLVVDNLPFLRWFDIGGHEKTMKEIGKEMDSLLQGWLDEIRGKRDTGKDISEVQNFMEVMMRVTEGADLVGFDADTVIKATCLGLITGGSDTVTVVLIWTLSLLMNNHHVMQKAKEELATYVGKDRQVNESDINNLVYLQAIVKETLRLYPPGPLSGPREFTEDCIVSGYHIPKGTRLTLNLWKLHRDPNVWSDPLEFRPERFLTTHKDVDIKGSNFGFLPFGAGRRICPGIALGIQMVHLVLANLLHGFELSTQSNALVDMTESAGLTNMKATPLELLVSPRLSSNLFTERSANVEYYR